MTSWYFKRLAAMSAWEIPYRLGRIIQSLYEEYFCQGKKLPEVSIPATRRIFDIKQTEDYIFTSECDIFGMTLNYAKDEIKWHTDLFSGESFPLMFSKKINIRNNPALSAKNVWEVNRLQFLPRISLNFKQTGNPKYLNQIIRILNSWIDCNPYLIGINWTSNIEVNIRLINWFFCWEILDINKLVADDPQFEKFVTERWIPSIYQHCSYSYKNHSKYSSANNHLISEYAGLFIASSKWKFSESGKWLESARKGLEKEIGLQHSNGINKEEAAEYIQFITDFFLLSYVTGEKTNNQFSGNYTQILKEIFEYIFAFVDIKGNFPNYGDSDDGSVVNFSTVRRFNNFMSLLTSASVIFRDGKFKLENTSFDLKNQMLFGYEGRKIFESFPENLKDRKSVFYTKEGHYIFRNQINGKEIYFHFNAAPLGYLSMAAHGHADALSVIMSINGYPIFVDPGTYSYHVSKEWREYFVSTKAHNTICINGQNQAYHAGDTIWLNHYKCKLIFNKNGGPIESVRAEHDGFKKTKHSREITFNKTELSFTIHDEINKSDSNAQDCELLFHLHPDIKVNRLSPNIFYLLHHTGIKVWVSMENFEDCPVINGRLDPVLGWYSDSFMQKVATNVLCAKKTIVRSFKSITKIQIHEY